MKKIIINESQLEHIIKEMAYPNTFNMDEFKSLTSFQKRVEYCRQRLKRLGAGTSRIVFEIDNEKVLKLAKNSKGVAQNQEEIRLGNDNFVNCFTKVYDYDERGLFVEMEKARPAKESDFERLTGYPWDIYCDFLRRIANSYTHPSRHTYINRSYNDAYEHFNENWDSDNFMCNVFDYMMNYQLRTWGDLERISSYGVVQRPWGEDLVIIDFGLSEDVWNNYYKK